jgi:hypothetical protein
MQLCPLREIWQTYSVGTLEVESSARPRIAEGTSRYLPSPASNQQRFPLRVAPGRGKSQEPPESFLRRGECHKASNIHFSEFILWRITSSLYV